MPQYRVSSQLNSPNDQFSDVEKDAVVRTTTRESRKSGRPLTSNPIILLLDLLTSKTRTQPSHLPPIPAPDGGLHPWLVVIFTHLVGFSTWGFLNTFGILQTYYAATLSLPPSTVSWIGSIQAFFLFFSATFSGRLTDAGYFHQTFCLGTVIHLLGIFGASFSTTYWQLFLSHGVCCGIGGGLIFCPALSVCATYFKKRQPLVMALCAAGTSTGGLVYAAVLQQLMPRLGFAWSMRVVGFIIAASLIPANFIIRPRRMKRSKGPIVEWSAFQDKQYSLFTVGMFFVMTGMWFPVYFVSFSLQFMLGLHA
jgi:MFS family permease